MEGFSSAVAVLTAMITPAVLISACGTLILSASTRLGKSLAPAELVQPHSPHHNRLTLRRTPIGKRQKT